MVDMLAKYERQKIKIIRIKNNIMSSQTQIHVNSALL